jgi:hypothetical protein
MTARYRLGRLLQSVGLLVPPFAIASQLMDKVSLGQSMGIALIGVALFYAGHQIQHGAA